MRAALAGLVAVATALLAAPQAQAALTATSARIADRGPYVRATISFSGTPKLLAGEVLLQDGNLESRGSTRLHVERRGVGSRARAVSRDGLSLTFATTARALRIGLRSDRPRTFKYLKYRVVGSRLVVDAFKREFGGDVADDGCLALGSAVLVGTNRVRLAGRAKQQLFERSLAIAVRDQTGRLLSTRGLMTDARNAWSGTLRIPKFRRNTSYTVEAIVQSAKDGSAECFVQGSFGVFDEEGR